MGILDKGVWLSGVDRQIGAQGWEPRQEHISGQVTPIGSGLSEYPAEAGRYHLVVCPGCPMSHRTWMVLQIKGLSAVSVSRVRPVMGENGREFGSFEAPASDPVSGFRYLYEMYLATNPQYSGRASTPVLWDRQTGKIVSNSYSDIFGFLNTQFNDSALRNVDFRPSHLAQELRDELAYIGSGLVGAVYRCGFTRDQAVYDDNIGAIAKTLPELDLRLSKSPFLLGSEVTEADLTLFACLIRYDAIYATLFQCSAARIEDFAHLTAFIKRVLALPGVADTFDLGLSMRHYYLSHAHINPSGIIPAAPRMSWL